MLLFIGPLLFSCLWICECKEVSARLKLELNYTNFGHYARTGWCDIFDRKCDVYFNICIWNASIAQPNACDVAKKKTSFISNSPETALTGQKTIDIPLSKPIPKFVRIRIEIWDEDISSSDDIIAKFITGDTQLLSHQPFHQVSLLKMDATSYNADVKLQIAIKLTCSPNYYGEQCQTFCKPDSERFYCGTNGEHKCIPGWRGEFCALIDSCFLKPCAPHARCLNTDDAEGRICYCNAGSGESKVPDQIVQLSGANRHVSDTLNFRSHF
uniref:Delta-like protein n=1 Tax=Mesocestoides corti TaxID=53468 RepID=A0A5K3F2S2_MESCO